MCIRDRANRTGGANWANWPVWRNRIDGANRTDWANRTGGANRADWFWSWSYCFYRLNGHSE